MSSTRATTYITAASVLVAWMAATDGVPSQPMPIVPAERPAAATDTLGDELRAQTQRLTERMSAAPEPRRQARNPFRFHAADAPVVSITHASQPASAASPAAFTPPEPRLDLVGIAGQDTPDGLVRTAMVMADGDTFLMLTRGQTLGAKYRVESIGPDTIDLTDLVTGQTRTLHLR